MRLFCWNWGAMYWIVLSSPLLLRRVSTVELKLKSSIETGCYTIELGMILSENKTL